MRRSLYLIAAAMTLAAWLPAGEPPAASTLRVALEAQFPKSAANETALELERLSARIGIDLAPRASDFRSSSPPAPL